MPLDGYGIVNLSLSEDGKVLIGQLKGGYGTVDQFTQKPHQNHAWDVDALIQAALAAPQSDRLVKHIALPVGAEQLIPTPASPPAGTAFEHAGLVVTDSNYIDDDGVIFLVDSELPGPVEPAEPGPILAAPSSGAGSGSPTAPAASSGPESTFNAGTGELRIRNNGATAINVDVVVSANSFLQWINPPSGGAVAIGANGEQTILRNEQIAAGATLVVRVMSKLTNEFVSSFTQADAFLGLATMKVFQRTGATLSATPSSTENVVYLADLTDGVRDTTLGFLPTVENQAGRKLTIYNPQHLDLRLKDLDVARFNDPTYNEATKTTTITLKASAARAAAYTANLEIRLVADQPAQPTQPLLRNLKISALVTPKQHLVIDFNKIKADLLSYQTQALAWKIAHPQTGSPPAGTPPIPWDEIGLTAITNIKGQGPLGYGGMYRSFLAALGTSVWDAAKWNIFQTQITAAFNTIYGSFTSDGSFEWHYGSNDPNASRFEYDSRTYGFVQQHQSDSAIAGRDDIANGWASLDVNLGSSGVGKLLTTAAVPAPFRTDLSPSEQRFIFYGAFNRISNDFGTIILDAFVRRTTLGPVTTTRSVEQYGKDLGWLLAHEFSHNLGLLDEYNGSDPNLPNVPGSSARVESYMKAYGSLLLQDFHRAQLRAAFHDASTSGEAVDELASIRTLIAKFVELARATRQLTLAPTEVDDVEALAQFVATDRVDGATMSSALMSSISTSAAGLSATSGVRTNPVDATDFDGGEATLVESATANAHLAERLVLGEGDRYLSFTIDARGLVPEDPGSMPGPADAFEVALLDAATGLPVAGTVALSGADALLNLQADGTERLAASVRRVDSADGSATYYIDLSALATRTTALASFDLLGFGVAKSRVTVRDVRLVSELRANDDIVRGDEDSTVAGNVLDNDLTLGAPLLRPQIVDGPAHGQLVLDDDGAFTYRPEPNFFGSDGFTYSFADTEGRVSNIGAARLQIRPVNDAPVAPADLGVTVRAGESFTFDPLAGASDVEGSPLSSQIVGLPMHGEIERNSDGSYSYSPRRSFVGADNFTYRVSDGELLSRVVTVSFDVLAAVSAPVARDLTLQLVEDIALPIDPSSLGIGTHGEVVGSIVTVQPSHGTLVIGPEGRWTYIPDPDFNGTDALRYLLIEDGVSSNEATLTLLVSAVNDAPVLADRAISVAEDGFALIDSLATASDVDGDGLVAMLVAGPRHGSLSVDADGSFHYTPTANFFGADSFTYRVTDGHLTSAIATVAITVTPVDDAPTAHDGAMALIENGSLTVDLRSFGADIDGPSLRAIVLVGPAHGILTPNANGTHTYRPDLNYHGADSLRFQLDDGELQSAVATLAFTVTPANGTQSPVAVDSMSSGVEDTALQLRWSDFNVSGGNGAQLQIVISGLPDEGMLQRRLADGSWTAVATGSIFDRASLDADKLRFVPAADASGGPGHLQGGYGNRHADYARIGFKAFDGTLASAEAHVVIDIAAVADMPSLRLSTAQPASGDEDTAFALPSVVAALSDSDGSESLVLTLTGLPIGATLADGVNSFVATADHRVLDLSGWNIGALQLTPPLDFNGRLVLQVQASAIEGSTGERATATQDLFVDVVAVADTPLLSLEPPGAGVSRELFATSWESAANPGTAATVLNSATFEGWSILPAARDRTAAFEVWAEGDRMRNAAGNTATVHAKQGDGSQWLALTNGTKTTTYQTYGIERSVPTVDGAVYTLTFDYAGALGLAKGNTRVVVEVDGKRIGSYADTSANTALSWQSVSFQFDGNGLQQMLTIRLEGDNSVGASRGAMIDAIRVVETLPNGVGDVYGFADAPIVLPGIVARLKDGAVSEQLGVTLGGLAVGSVLSDGVHSVLVTAPGQLVEITSWNLARVALLAPAGFTGTMALTVRATSREPSNGATASVQQSIAVHVLDGHAVATPVGVNPFVTMTAGERSTSSTPGAGIVLQSPASLSAAVPVLSSRGQIVFSSTPLVPLARKLDDDDQQELDRSSSLRDAWLIELEQLAQQQWHALNEING